MKQILFFGDSLTAGYGLANPATQSLPALIQQRITDENLPYEIINGGVSGDTSSAALNRLGYWIARPIEVFVLELGINDVMRGVPSSATYLNLDNVLKKVRQKYPNCSMAVMGMELPPLSALPKVAEFKNIFTRLAEEHGAMLVPSFLDGVAGMKHLNLKDGIHPSHKGYQIIADRVWPFIKGLLKQQN